MLAPRGIAPLPCSGNLARDGVVDDPLGSEPRHTEPAARRRSRRVGGQSIAYQIRVSPVAETSTDTDDETQTGSWIRSAVLSVVILAAAGGFAFWTFTTEPTAEKGGASKKTAMLAEVVEVERGTYRPRIVTQGTVEPAREIELRPQVGGRVTSLTSALVPGGYAEEGELLMTIEAEDYRHTLAQRKSELGQAEADLAVARGRHDAARAEYSRFGEELEPENEALVVREPQLEAAKQRVDAAQAAVDQAQLDLSRTTVEAPFDAQIVRRDVNVGSQLSPNDTIARLIGAERYWVGLEVPLSKLRWLAIEGEDGEGSTVRIRNQGAWPEGTYRSGHLFKKVGVLDDETRMARVLAEIPDPLARETEQANKPELVVGEFVEVTIEGKPIEDVVKLDRDYVREDDTIWVMDAGKLRIRDAEIVVRDAEYAYISEGLSDGARVVTTQLSTVKDGAALRLNAGGSDEADGGESDEGASGE